MISIIDKELGIRRKFSDRVEAGYFLIGLELGHTTIPKKSKPYSSKKTTNKENRLLAIYESTKKSKKVFDTTEEFYSYLNS